MGGDELTPDSSQEREGKMEYKCSWLTNGYQPTRKGVSDSNVIMCSFFLSRCCCTAGSQ